MKSRLLALLLIGTLSIGSAFAASRSWSLSDMNGGKFSLDENTGNSPILLIFWATWCAPCKQELNEMRATFDSYAASGVKVVLVSEDNQKSKSRVKPYVDGKGYTWTSLLDPDGEVLKMYGGTSIPYTVLLDGGGEPQLKHRGEMKSPAELSSKIQELSK